MNSLLMGAIAMASFVAALCFFRFWKNTRDRFFLLFSLAFVIDAMGRVVLGLMSLSEEQEPLVYITRLLMFGLILVAIYDKNRSKQ